VSRLHRRLDGPDELGADRFQVNIISDPAGEGCHHPLGIVASPVEPTIHQSLDPSAERIEEGNSGQGGGGNAQR
jgi:hypothetical protein